MISYPLVSAPAGGIFSGPDPWVDVKAYGAVGDGVTDDTAAILKAFTGASRLYFPPGSYVYNGPGLAAGDYNIEGAGIDATIILLGAASYFIASATVISSLNLRGIRFQGGLGAVHHTYAGTNVTLQFVVDQCYFNGYTQCAIGSTATDMPYWKISRCVFHAGNSTTSIGVALPGFTDQDALTDCAFLLNRVHAKFQLGGNNVIIRNCDFIQFGGGASRASVWVVPNPASVNAGQGLLIDGCKFGNENLDASDYRILYADEAAGTDFTTKLPNVGADSVGYIQMHTVSRVDIIGGTSNPFVYSTTPNISGCTYENLVIAGTPPSYLIQYRTPPTPDRLNQLNTVGPLNIAQGSESVSIPISNAVGVAAVKDDPLGLLLDNAETTLQPAGGSDFTGYVDVVATRIRAYTPEPGVTLGNVADSEGNADAAEVIAPGNASVYAYQTTQPTVGLPLWIEFDLKQGSVSSVPIVEATFQTDTNAFYWKRRMTLRATWTRYRYRFAPRATGAALIMKFNLLGIGRAQVGRVRVYQAREPQPYSVHLFGGLALGTPSLGLQSSQMYAGAGVPNNGNGNNGDYYFRSDTPATANQRLYVKSAGAWVGIL